MRLKFMVRAICTSTATVLAFLLLQTASAMGQGLSKDLGTQPLASALEIFAADTGLQLVYRAELASGLTSKGARAGQSAEETLRELLRETGLTFEFLNNRTIAIHSADATGSNDSEALTPLLGRSPGTRLAQATDPPPGTGEKRARDSAKVRETESYESQELPAPEETGKVVPEVLVRGSLSTNVDIRRTEDDVQPYVILGHEEIVQSQSLNLEDFLKTRLTMNAASQTIDQQSAAQLNAGAINLRGVGANQTLVLIDGRRVPSISSPEDFGQPDISGIPLASIERIEVLPTTASGIYGGSATGGVINIIRKRDYTGIDLEAKYGVVSSSDADNIELNLIGGFSLQEGRTHIGLSATYSQADPLLVSERDFAMRAREQILANSPASIANLFNAPIGTTPNICAARSSTSTACGTTPLVLDSGQSLGSSYTSVPPGYAGPLSDGGAALVANAGSYNLAVPANGSQILLRTPLRTALALNGRHEFGANFEAFVDFSGNRSQSDVITAGSMPRVNLAADAPNNPFQQPIAVGLNLPDVRFPGESETELLQAAGGIVARFGNEWAATLEYNWSRSRNEYKFTNIDAGLTAAGLSLLSSSALQDLNQYPIDIEPYLTSSFDNIGGPFETVLESTALRVSGPLFDLPAGPVNLTTLIERRKELQEEAFSQIPSGTTLFPERSQDVNSYYLETRFPIIGADQEIRFARTLEVQASIRRDEYETTSTTDFSTAPTRDGPFAVPNYSTNRVSSTDHTLGLRFSPIEAITLRGSYGTGFLPAGLTQISPFIEVLEDSLGLTDPRRGDTDAYNGQPITYISAGNPNLEPESSESWSAGLILTPTLLRGLRFSADYTEIRKSGEILFPDQVFILQNEALFPGRVVRGPNLPDDPATWAGPITQLDASTVNLSETRVEAIDFQIDYDIKTAKLGTFGFSTSATHTKTFARQITSDTPVYDSVGYRDGPLEWKGNFSLTWSMGDGMLAWNTQYFDSYSVQFADPSTPPARNAFVATVQGSIEVPSQTYHDLFARYRFTGGSWGVLDGFAIALCIQNVFDTTPSFLAPTSATNVSNVGAYGYSTYADPRQRRLTLSVQKHFGD